MADRTQPQQPKHDPRTCKCCAFFRHPAQVGNARALKRHLADHPFPRQEAQR